jgi:hypothetical protein
MKGGERVRADDMPDRAYFRLKGSKAEYGLGQNDYNTKVPEGLIYSLDKDPLKFRHAEFAPGANALERRTLMEKRLKEKGYIGYRAGDTFAIFEKLAAEPAWKEGK